MLRNLVGCSDFNFPQSYVDQNERPPQGPSIYFADFTDVKHVAHIGWVGPSVTSPNWMNEFKSSPCHTTPLDTVDKVLFKDDSFSQQASEGSSRGGVRSQSCYCSPAQELLDLPRSTARNSSTGTSGDSPTKAKSERVRRPKRSSKGSNGKDATDGSKQLSEDRIGEVDSPTRRQHPDVPKKSRRNKSKDSGGGSTRSSSRSKTKASSSPWNEAQYSDPGTKEVSVFEDRDLSESTRRRAMEDAEDEDEDEDEKLHGPLIPNRWILKEKTRSIKMIIQSRGWI